MVESDSLGGLLPAFSAIPAQRAATIARTIERWSEAVPFIIPSQDPADPRFEPNRYWRGPVWLVTNYRIGDGLAAIGEHGVAAHITRSSLELITKSGFAEYYDPITAEPCGGGRFTWTAAMVLEFLDAARA